MYKIVDKLLDDFCWFRDYCDQLHYDTLTNPMEKVDYPGINRQIPIGVNGEVVYKLEKILNIKIKEYTPFLRMTLDGVEVPHQAHNDSVMGQYGIILYLNSKDHCKGGTSFVEHKVMGFNKNPKNDTEQEAWEKDTNNYDAWHITDYVEMRENRALIFESNRMHRPEPPTSFGIDSKTGRLTYSAFFTKW